MSVVFWIAAAVAVAAALGVIVAKTPVHSVISLILNFIALATLYLSLHAEFVAIVQIIIYAGAIMVLFLFVVALLTVRKSPVEGLVNRLEGQRELAMVTVLGSALLLASVIVAGQPRRFLSSNMIDATFGSAAKFGETLLKRHLLAFELTAFVLLAAVIGVVVLVGREHDRSS